MPNCNILKFMMESHPYFIYRATFHIGIAYEHSVIQFSDTANTIEYMTAYCKGTTEVVGVKAT